MNWQNLVFSFFTYGIMIYSAVLLISYVLIGIYSIEETKYYLEKNSFTNYSAISSSHKAPSITVIAPAYNEGRTIIENVRSILSLHYSNIEVVIVNDGSTDDTLEKLIEVYHLTKRNVFINQQLKTKKIRGIYKSSNPIYKKLIIIDKENGGKSDALNCGINISSHEYVASVDVDCVLEQDALLKLVKPFLEKTNKTVIATGGVIRIANSCVVENGRLVKVNLPKEFLPRVQTVEYIRAFLLGRMAWSRLNGLLLISGAFGAFKKDVVIKSGGYNTNTVGEDIELVVRMRLYMEDHDLPYDVAFIPDPLCWTEAPSTFKVLGQQRNRWTRGTIETLRAHKRVFFNPKYGVLGMLSYPFWFFFEFLAPIIEFAGTLSIIVLAFFGMVHWEFFLNLVLMVFSFGLLYSVFAILMEVLTYNQYKKGGDILKLTLIAAIEPLIFHPFLVLTAIKGNIDYLRKKKGWGKMTRKGFTEEQEEERPEGIPEKILEEKTEEKLEGKIKWKLTPLRKNTFLKKILKNGIDIERKTRRKTKWKARRKI